MSIFILLSRSIHNGDKGYTLDSFVPFVRKELLLDNFERSALAVTGGGTVYQRPDRLNGLTIAADDAANIALTELQLENRRFTPRNFCQHHLVGEFNELPYHKLEKLFHADSGGDGCGGGDSGAAGAGDGVSVAAGASAGFGGVEAFLAAAASAFARAAAGFLFFLIKLRTVSEGWAPLLIQYSARSSFKVLLWPGFFGS